MKYPNYLKISYLLSIFLVNLIGFSINSESQTNKRYVKKWRKIPGAPTLIYLDKKTSLSGLVSRLPIENVNDTGKTRCMCSIADYGRKAINPLLVLFRQDSNRTTRETVISTLYLIMIDNVAYERPWMHDIKLAEPLAKKALMSLLSYTGYEDQICGLLDGYFEKSDLHLFKETLQRRTVESLEFYDTIYFLFNYYYSKDDRIKFMIPNTIYECYMTDNGTVVQPEYERILKWIASGKALNISSQIRSDQDWKLLSLGGIYSEVEVLKRYLEKNCKCDAPNINCQRIFICQAGEVLYVFGTLQSREKWIAILENYGS